MTFSDPLWLITKGRARITTRKFLRIFVTLGIVVSSSLVSVFVAAPATLAAVTSTPTCSSDVGVGGATTSDTAAQGGNGCVVIQYVLNATTLYETFSYTGIDQQWTVPSGVTSVDFHLIGAGGGAGRNNTTSTGGGGGYATGRYTVTPGDAFTIIVGQGGRRQTRADVDLLTDDTMRRNASFGGGATGRLPACGNTCNLTFASGGGRSAIRDADDREIATAGGGGGGGYGGTGGGAGGAGGGLVGGKAAAAGGGTQTAGGARDTHDTTSVAGIQFAGGFASNQYQSGGGGGGWYGGGGGAGNRGGGGGSSYVALLIGGATTAGNGPNPGLGALVNTTAPRIVGSSGKAVGTTLTAIGGTWSSPGLQSWTWQYSSDGTNFSDISDATSSTYVTTQPGYFRAVETHSNLLFATSVNSSNVIQHLELSPASTPSCTTGAGTGGLPFGNLASEVPKSIGGHGCVVIEYRNAGARLYETFDYVGTDQGWTVPNGVNEVIFHLIGAGGGGATRAGYGNGGAGGYATGSYPVAPGDRFEVIVGQAGGGVFGESGTVNNCLHTPRTYGGGGEGGSCRVSSGGNTYPPINFSYSSGGGRSAIRVAGQETDLATAGGGGGGGYGTAHGGAGGGLIGSQGMLNGGVHRNGGSGGTQTAGGARGYSQRANGTAGLPLQGGRSDDEGGGGGGGYFGGGGGGDNAGGGGGSSYVAELTNGTTVAGIGREAGLKTPVNTTPPVINGLPAIGTTLTATGGVWAVTGIQSWQWQFSTNGVTYTNIDSATSITLENAQAGFYRAIETQSVLLGSVSATTNVIQVYPPPTARPDSATGGSATAITVLPASNDTGASGATINASSVRLCAPNDVAPVCAETSLTVVNEGTYSVNTTTGVVTFTGDAGFIGTSTVTYSIADSRGTRASSTISFTTLAPPTARPDASAAQRGDNQSASPLANDFASGSATLDLDSLRLCGISPVESSPSCTQTSISIADEGTYSISNGVVVFTADVQYTGTRVLHYIVRDSTSQVATSTITFTALPPPAVSASPESVTVEHATTASFTPLSSDSAGFIPSDYTTQGTVTLNVSSLKLCSAGETISTGCTKTSVVVAYEGTWSLSGSAVTFVPLATFSGIATSMPYVVCNTVSGTWAPGTPPETCGSSVMSVTVNAPAAPVPEPDLLSAQFGNRTSIYPLANDQGASLSPSRLRLCEITEIAPACFSTSIVIANQGTWTLDTSTGLVEFEPLPLFTGTSTITYMSSDIVGATFSSSISATIQAPAQPSAQPDTASGTAGSGSIVVTPLLNDTGTGLSFTSLRLCGPSDTAPSCSALSLTVNNQGTWSINAFNGDITFTPEGGFTGTTTAVTYSVLDVLDRPTSSTITVTISAIAAPDTPSLLESSDTGASSTDNVTNDVTPAIRAHGVADGDTVTVTATNGTTTVTCTYVVSANVSECHLPPLSDGEWTITSTRTDSQNNTSTASAPLTIVIDTTPPDAPMAPVLDSASDDGTSSTDNITSVTTPTVGVGNGASGETVTMTATQDSTTVSCTYDAETATSCELQTLSEGTWLVTAVITDAAGNDSASSPALTLVIVSSTPTQNVPATTPTTVPATTTTTIPNAPIQATNSIPTTTTVPITTTTLPNSQIPYTIAEKDKIINDVAAVAGMPEDGWVKVEKSDSSITITTSDGLLIKIGAKVKSSKTLRLNSRGMIIFEANDFITIAGGGLKPLTPASTWLFSTPRQLGLLTTDSNGSFNEEYPIGEDVEVGDHTAQLNGIAPDGTLRVVEIAIEIIATPEDTAMVIGRNTNEVPPASPLSTSSTIALFASAFALLAITRRRINALSSQDVWTKAGHDDRPDRIRVPRLQWIDNAMNRLACAIDRTSPMLARIADNGAYARSLFGLLWPLLPIAGVVLGIVSAFNTEFVMMVPVLSLVIAIAVLGVIDAFAGFMFVLSFGISMLIGGGFNSVDSFRGFLGIAVFSFAPVMIAALARPFRRITTHTLSTWNRSVDFVLTALFGSWAAGTMYGALPSLTAYKPEHSDRVDLLYAVFLVAIALRWILENTARIYMPRRLQVVEVEEFEDTTHTQRVTSDVIRTAVFVFVAIVFIGNNWALWTGAAMFFIPRVVREFADSFKNLAGLYRFVPRKLTRVVTILFVGLWLGKLVQNQFGDSDNVLLYAFVLMSIPGITFGCLDWFVRDGKKWESTPLSRTLGVLVLIVGITSVRGFIP